MRDFSTGTADPLLPVDAALESILSRVTALPSETVPLVAAYGRTLREDVIAAGDVPPADNSAMDGYALRAEDTPGSLRVIGDLPAGKAADGAVEAGTAIRIMTGAPIPPGANAVAQVEITDRGSSVVTIHRAVPSGANVRLRGDDMRAGSLILGSGTRLGAAEVAVAAAARRENLEVARRPLVAVMATGDELGAGIVDSNSWALAGLVEETGGISRRQAIVRDSLDATVAAIEASLDADIVVSTGGVSVGAYDFIREALEALDATIHFWRVAMKPGKPVLFATVRDRFFFGLPGNPVSAIVSFTLFVAPAIRKALGQSTLLAPTVLMRTAAPLKGADDRRAYLRVRVIALQGELIAEPMSAQGSHVATSMVRANGLAIVERPRIEKGELVPVMLIGPISAA